MACLAFPPPSSLFLLSLFLLFFFFGGVFRFLSVCVGESRESERKRREQDLVVLGCNLVSQRLTLSLYLAYWPRMAMGGGGVFTLFRFSFC